MHGSRQCQVVIKTSDVHSQNRCLERYSVGITEKVQSKCSKAYLRVYKESIVMCRRGTKKFPDCYCIRAKWRLKPKFTFEPSQLMNIDVRVRKSSSKHVSVIQKICVVWRQFINFLAPVETVAKQNLFFKLSLAIGLTSGINAIDFYFYSE